MIRLNAFFELREDVRTEEAVLLGKELVEKSRMDEGNVAYDLFQSTMNPRVMMFCETWTDDECLKKHSNAEHFTRIVPQIELLTRNGLKLERFDL